MVGFAGKNVIKTYIINNSKILGVVGLDDLVLPLKHIEVKFDLINWVRQIFLSTLTNSSGECSSPVSFAHEFYVSIKMDLAYFLLQ